MQSMIAMMSKMMISE